jgi:hypothetical protein
MSYAGRRVVLFGAFLFVLLALPSFAASPPAISFSATPDDIAFGQTSTLVWDTTNADSVTIDNGVGSQPVSGSVTVQPSVTTTYTLTASGPGGTSSSQVTVTVTRRPIITFFANAQRIVAGSSAKLLWSVANTLSVSIDNGIGPVPADGSILVSPTTTTTYTMTAVGTGGNSVAQVTIEVIELPQITFTADPSTISPGGSSTLSWSVTGTNFARLNQIDVFPSGTMTVAPEKTTLYRLTATNEAGTATATVTVTVPVPVPPKHRAVKH